jgi:hypothetical protein
MFIPGGPSLLTKYGYWEIAGVVRLESMGVPLPGEATLIAAGIYAGTGKHLNIWMVIAAASVGAILGDNLGFWIGREIGFRLLLRHGGYVQLTEKRIKLGQYLFQPWRQNRLFRSIHRSAAVLGCFVGRRQSDGVDSLSSFQCCRRSSLGDTLRTRRLLPRTRA